MYHADSIFFPYKRLIEFNKDGTGRVGFFGHSIENNISMEFLKTQMEEINDLNNRFTFQLKEGKHKISMAMALANTSLDASTRDQVPKYIDRLIEYLENHQKLAIPLGVTIKKYEFLMEKVVRWKVVLISVILLSCFIIGVVIPMFLDIGKLSSLVTVSLFFIGISLLFYDAIISKSIPSIKPQSVESEFQNKEHIARGLPENGEELPWTEYNINVSQHLPSCVKEKIMMLGARHELTDFGGIPKYLGISLNHSVEIGKLKLLLSILKDCSVQLDYISYNKFDVGPTVGLGRTITVGGFNYKHGPVTRVDHFLLSKLLDPNTTQKDLERLLISGYTFKQD